MADFDDSNEKKGQRLEDMSLADLLGADDSTQAATPRRVDHRDDEPDSGMVRLADMVAKSSPGQARVPSIAPPAAQTQGTAPVMPAAAPGAFQPLSEDGFGRPSLTPSIPPDPRKPTLPVIIAIATVVVVVGAAVAFFIIQKKSAEEAERIMQLRIQVEELEKKKQRDEMMAKLEDLQRKEREAQKRAEEERAAAEKAAEEKAALEKALEEKALEEQEEQEEQEEEEAKTTKKGKKKKGKKAKKKAAKAKATSPTSQWTPVKESTPPKEDGDELDALIGGGSKKGAEKPAEAASGGGKPSKAEVKAAMAPVNAKAQSCAKYSTGTVQLKVTVGSNGKVLQSQAMGSFANTTAGKCVEMIARTAKFNSFSDPSFTFTYPITLR